MAVNYNAVLRDARMTAVITAIDADPTDPGELVIFAADGTTELVRIELVKPSFVEAAGVITMQGTAGGARSGDATAGGVATTAKIESGAGAVVVGGLTVGTAAPAEIIVNSTAISTGQTVTISTGTITHSGTVAT